MTAIDIHALMGGLAGKRPVFHSEADFQFALAWEIKEATGNDVRLEFPPFPEERMYLDIWIPAIGTAVELKYLTRELAVTAASEPFSLRNQGAQDLGRYDFLKDVYRLERVIESTPGERRGIAVLVTNDSLYWKPPNQEDTIDAEFRVHQDRELPRKMRWSERASIGTTKGRESPIILTDSYICKWRDYGRPVVSNAKNARFRYLALEVSR